MDGPSRTRAILLDSTTRWRQEFELRRAGVSVLPDPPPASRLEETVDDLAYASRLLQRPAAVFFNAQPVVVDAPHDTRASVMERFDRERLPAGVRRAPAAQEGGLSYADIRRCVRREGGDMISFAVMSLRQGGDICRFRAGLYAEGRDDMRAPPGLSMAEWKERCDEQIGYWTSCYRVSASVRALWQRPLPSA